MDDAVGSWTGREADALRQALRMTNESFAEHLGVAVRTVAYWRRRPDLVPRPAMQEILDAALAQAPDQARAQFWRLLADGQRTREAVLAASGLPALDDAVSLTEWLTATGTSDETISQIDRAASALAEAHARTAPSAVLAEVRQLQRTTQALLRNGRPRHRQARGLLRVNGDLLAHMSLLLSDLNDDHGADEYGNAALLYFREAGAREARAWYVLAKAARWRHHYGQAADLASQGFQGSAPDPMRLQLAWYEANASALIGDNSRARAATRQAEEVSASLTAGMMTASPWSFPSERMTIFRVSVALRTGDPDDALSAAATSAEDWTADGTHVPAAWAQTRVGAAIAHLLKDELDGTAEQVTPMFSLPPEFRIATVTGWLADLDRKLQAKRYAENPLATDLRYRIREFSRTTPTGRA